MARAWEVEIHAWRRERHAKSHSDEYRVITKSYVPTKAEATRLLRDKMDRMGTSWDDGGDYHGNIHGRVKRLDKAPETEGRFIRQERYRRAPAVRDSAGRYHDRKGRLLRSSEAHRRNRISRSMRGLRAAERRLKAAEATKGPGKWSEEEVFGAVSYIDLKEDDFLAYEPDFEEPEEEEA